MSWRIVAIAIIASSCVTFIATRYFFPRVDTRIEVREKEVVKKDIVTVVKEIVRPDGTKETTSTTTDHSTEKHDSTSLTIVNKKPDWLVGAGLSLRSYGAEPTYNLQVSRRILGPIFAGVRVGTDKSFGALLTMEF